MLALGVLALTAVLVLIAWIQRPRNLLVPAAIALFALAPVAFHKLVWFLVSTYGCTGRPVHLDPCMAHGMDLAPLFQEMFYLGFAAVLTLLTGALLLLIWLWQMRWPPRERWGRTSTSRSQD